MSEQLLERKGQKGLEILLIEENSIRNDTVIKFDLN